MGQIPAPTAAFQSVLKQDTEPHAPDEQLDPCMAAPNVSMD